MLPVVGETFGHAPAGRAVCIRAALTIEGAGAALCQRGDADPTETDSRAFRMVTELLPRVDGEGVGTQVTSRRGRARGIADASLGRSEPAAAQAPLAFEGGTTRRAGVQLAGEETLAGLR